MSSDGYFEDLSFDDAALAELDAIEAAHHKPPETKSLADDSFDNIEFDIDESELALVDSFVQGSSTAATCLPRPQRLVQSTLDGAVLRTNNNLQHRSKPASPKKTKIWDHTEYAKSGLKHKKSKMPHQDDGGDVEFEQFPPPATSVEPPPPMKQSPDLLLAKHWIYPTNKPKRDYQFNIVKKSLFENTIVSLPTGLGKTFIAGVIMLNYYTWFPDGKVVFVAPTKPLVAQQISACHDCCGIPGSHATEMTGEVNSQQRRALWQQKRVVYMTPQTLINDLTKGNCEPRDIVLLVIDEAHKATGDYAYNQVVRFMMAKNPHFRLLALTATPGATPDAVQTLIDGLHISRIEIRDEDSPDLKQYIHNKSIETHIITMTGDIQKIQSALARVMEELITPLRAHGIFMSNPLYLHPYAPQAKMRELPRNSGHLTAKLLLLSSLARAMGYLVEGTINMCYNELLSIRSSSDGSKAWKDKQKAKLIEQQSFQLLMAEIDQQQTIGFGMHPKMEKLKTLLIQHFGQRMEDEDGKPAEPTKAMVFVTHRPAVDEIVEFLNQDSPLIRASKFVGQSTDKAGGKGMSQKIQLEVIKKFREDEFNVLVATSVGEEGLDIGEVDLIVCYDSQKTPIRMLQRLGRTGRKRAGVVHILLAEGREDRNLDKAQDAYKTVQKTIYTGSDLYFYKDVDRLLPDHIQPICVERYMPIEPYDRESDKRRVPTAREVSKGTKRKRDHDVGRNIPQGASTGFVSAKDLVPRPQKKAKPLRKDFDQAGEDDEVDLDIESGDILNPQRRTVSFTAAEPRKKTKLPRRSNTLNGTTKRRSKVAKLTSSQFSALGVDADDMDIENGIILPPNSAAPSPTGKKTNSQTMAWLIDDGSDIEISGPIPVKDVEDEIEFLDSPQRPKSNEEAMEVDCNEQAQTVFQPTPPTLGSRSARRARLVVSSSDSEDDQLSTAPSRIRRGPHAAPTIHTKNAGGKRPLGSRKDNRLFDYEAAHSGDEVSEGNSGEDEPESESDRQFMQCLPETQLPPSYPQTQIYHTSLLTQAPAGGPAFKSKPLRSRLNNLSSAHRAVQVSSSPVQRSSDEYELGTFVVDDDAEISYLDQSSEL